MVELGGTQLTRSDLAARVGRFEQIAGIELLEAGDGAARGVRILQVRAGNGFDFEILVDRGFDVGRASLRGEALAWWSPVGLSGPWYAEPLGLGWFRGFPGGLVSTCGLDHTLLGGDDDATVFDFPHRQTETYGLHGRFTGLPARLIGYGVDWHGDEATIWAEGEVRQMAVFGEQLLLTRRIEVPLGGTALRLKDVVTNVGPTICPHMMLYHCNVGYPVVDAGSRLIYPATSATCVSEASSDNYAVLDAPQSPYVEQCYEHEMAADAEGWVTAGILNEERQLAVYQRYRKGALPHHITWRQLGVGTYVVAMEPSTNHDAGRFDARKRGELDHLLPGEQRHYELEIGAVSGPGAVALAAAVDQGLPWSR
jgi:hypothetical protein